MERKKRRLVIEAVPLDEIEIGNWNVRHRDITAGLDELAESLDRYGQLQPITVYRKNSRYEIIIGQRRYLAAKQLGWPDIYARILPPGIDRLNATILSFVENSQRRELSPKDKEEACVYLMQEFGSPAEVARQLGFSEATVRKWLQFSTVPEKIKGMVIDRKITRDQAIRLSQHVDDEKKAIEIAERISEINPPKEERERLFNEIEESPVSSIDTIFNRAKEEKEQRDINFILTAKYAQLMDLAEKRLDREGNELARDATVEWLDLMEY